jgi:hypothetical protein
VAGVNTAHVLLHVAAANKLVHATIRRLHMEEQIASAIRFDLATHTPVRSTVAGVHTASVLFRVAVARRSVHAPIRCLQMVVQLALAKWCNPATRTPVRLSMVVGVHSAHVLPSVAVANKLAHAPIRHLQMVAQLASVRAVNHARQKHVLWWIFFLPLSPEWGKLCI